MSELTRAYYTPEEAGEYLAVSAETIRNLCRAGKIRGARQVGKQWRIPRSYLEHPPDIEDEDTQEETRRK